MSCYACTHNAVAYPPPREAVLLGEHWRVAHAFDTDLRGWLVLVARSHVASLAELPADAGAELGLLLRDLSAALERVTGCLKTYVMQFSEADGFAHLHVHLVPRMPDQPEAHRGPRVFAHLGLDEATRLAPETCDEVALAVRAALQSL